MANDALSGLGSHASIIGLPIAVGTTIWQCRENVATGGKAYNERMPGGRAIAGFLPSRYEVAMASARNLKTAIGDIRQALASGSRR